MVQPGWEFLIDTREKEPFRNLVKQKDIPHRVTTLNADIVLRRNTSPAAEVVGIERKAINDLVQSIQSGRIFDQVKRLKQLHEICFLFISGSLDELQWKFKQQLNMQINTSVVYGTLASIIVRERIGVMWFPDDRSLIEVAYRVCTKISEGKWGEERTLAAKYEMYDAKKMLQRTVPGLTQSKVKRLFDRFKTLKGIALAEPEHLQSVDGIGPETAKLIWNLFNKE